MRVVVTTPSRLHFGLIDLEGSMGRRFGSLGLAIDRPRIVLEASPSRRLRIEGDQDGRVESFAKRFLEHYRIRGGARIVLHETIPPHEGLGSGTQLALAVASSLAKLFSLETSVRELAKVLGRGKRSGIGVAAFEQGGFIVDGGKTLDPRLLNSPPPVIFRHPFPEDWIFVVVIPETNRGLSGEREEEAFRRLTAPSSKEVGTLCRLLVMKMLPALIEKDPMSFGSALTEIQKIVGRWFRAIQGGTYANQLLTGILRQMARSGALGVGQSSWGPTVYGLVEGSEKASALEDDLRRFIERKKVEALFSQARANNHGARVVIED
ncbi:MAG: beta-ribofuranosylaminobenzene 5'-phosphate synthase family protein [Candidatus Methylomirabilales bacterium]